MTENKKNLIHSALNFFSGTMLSRVSGLLRDVSMAYAFGADSFVAALLVAFRLANLLRRVLGEGAMQSAFIPHFEALKKTSPLRAHNFFCDLIGILSLVLVVIIAIVMGSLAVMLHFKLFNEGNATIAWLTLVMMPSLLFICLFGINTALLQCEKNYFLPGFAPVLFNLMWVIGTICTAQFGSERAMTYLALFIVTGFIAQWAITLPKVFSLLSKYKMSRYVDCKWSEDVKQLIKPLTLGVIGVAASQINNTFDALFARHIDDLGPAFLWYAIRLQQLPLALFGITLSSVLLPPLSRAIKSNDQTQFTFLLNFAFTRTLAFIIPITFLLFILGDQCVALIYGHGDFGDVSITGTTVVLWGYAIGLLPMALILILAPAFYAKKDYKTPTIASTTSMILNILLNTFFVFYLNYGTFSIALATSLSAWFNFLWLVISLSPTLIFSWMKHSLLIVILSLSACLPVLAIDIYLWNDFTLFTLINGEIADHSFSFLNKLIHLCVDSLIFIGIILGIYKFSLEQKQDKFA